MTNSERQQLENSSTFVSMGAPIGNNRVNSSGLFSPNEKNRTSTFIQGTLAAGDTLPFSVSGTTFYITSSTNLVSIRPSGGAFASYVQGTGLKIRDENSFNLLEVKNNNAFDVAFQIFVGWDNFIDNRVIMSSQQYPSIVYPTQSVANTATDILIKDRTGQAIADINGNTFFALSRQSILISNTSSSTVLYLQKYNTIISGGPSVAVIPAGQVMRFDFSGDYALCNGGATIAAIVAEVYSAIPS